MPDLIRNPDILTCLANLSNDEVFTPPEVANAMLDLIPEDFWKDPNVRVLDPACKSGVFLREAAKRFLKGEEEAIPDLQERIDHIFHKQLFGYAITELTSHLSRRTVYCSKTADGKYSVTKFKSEKGNIAFSRIEHTWEDGKCKYCGASQEVFDRGEEAETHAYKFIHLSSQQIKDLDMKFDLIIGNPPYQLEDGGNNASARPIYHLFVQQAKKLRPRYISMITPSRWFNGGKGLDNYRAEMLSDRHIRAIIDYQNAKECFPGVSIGGGVNYFLWDRDNPGECSITNVTGETRITEKRMLDEFPVFVRSNKAVEIIHKINNVSKNTITSYIGTRNPFALDTHKTGSDSPFKESLCMHTSRGKCYIQKTEVKKSEDMIDKWKTMISCIGSEHAGEPDKDGMYKVLSTVKVIGPGEVCTDSYLICFASDNENQATNFCDYLRTKFVRFLVVIVLSSIHITANTFSLVPVQDFSRNWTDDELYKKYNLNDDEISFIESMIKPME